MYISCMDLLMIDYFSSTFSKLINLKLDEGSRLDNFNILTIDLNKVLRRPMGLSGEKWVRV